MVINKTKIIIAIVAIFVVFLVGCSKKSPEEVISDSLSPYINQLDSSTTAITSGIAGIEFNGGTVTAHVFVKSTENFPIDHLYAGNFTIREVYNDGQGGYDTLIPEYNDIRIERGTNSNSEHVSVVLLKSNASTVAEDVTTINAEMKRIASYKKAIDSMAVISFHSYDTLLTDFTKNIALIAAGIDEPDYWGRSAEFRGIYRAIEELEDQTGRKGIIVFGDGLNNEPPSNQTALIDSLVSADIPVFFVVYGESADSISLEQICIQTGGYYTYYHTSGSLWGMVDMIRNNYNLYQISWTSATPSGTRGRIEISAQYQSAAGISTSTSLYYFEAP